jgi:catechol 2,3-dioxygenase-like lactoylglutathione lyase family enzyme
MPVLGLHHAGLYVASLEHSIAFYQTIFGLELAEHITFGGEEIAFLHVGGSRLELIHSPDRPTHGQKEPGVLDHVAFEVDGLDTLRGHLAANGVTLLDPEPIAVPALNARILFCLGPDAERIELFERRR